MADDSSVTPVFEMHPVQDPAQTQSEGRPIFRDIPYVTILVPNDRLNQIVRKVTDADKARWSDAWGRFQASQKRTMSGTPLEEWPPMSRSMVASLRASNIHTVEALAAINDPGQQVQFLGTDGKSWVEKANLFLHEAKDRALSYQALEEVEVLKQQVSILTEQKAGLEREVARLTAQVEALQGSKGAAVPTEDPIDRAQFQPAPANIWSSPGAAAVSVADEPERPSPADDPHFFAIPGTAA